MGCTELILSSSSAKLFCLLFMCVYVIHIELLKGGLKKDFSVSKKYAIGLVKWLRKYIAAKPGGLSSVPGIETRREQTLKSIF